MPIGDWKIEKTLTAGGQGQIDLVRRSSGGGDTLFALKRLKNRADPDRLSRFRREVDAGLRLDHPGILRPLDYALYGDAPYFVTEYLPRGSFAAQDFSGWTIVRRLHLFRKVFVSIRRSSTRKEHFGRSTISFQPNSDIAAMITREMLASRLTDYLKREISLAELVDWAERAMMDEDFEERSFEVVRDITSRLGLADVRAFGLTWEDCERYLSRLGYRAKVEVIQTP